MREKHVKLLFPGEQIPFAVVVHGEIRLSFHVLAFVVRDNHYLTFLAQNSTGHEPAVAQYKDGCAKGGIDVAIGIEDVFQQTVQASHPDAI